ncbi:hypothetical protein KEM48_014524 [Puccinia striiformis f. sp. tritici PST-130]|nr:hypothetical protein KEM48_014524 [Puccinia striiformis f. sp. tritici PST-130]
MSSQPPPHLDTVIKLSASSSPNGSSNASDYPRQSAHYKHGFVWRVSKHHTGGKTFPSKRSNHNYWGH